MQVAVTPHSRSPGLRRRLLGGCARGALLALPMAVPLGVALPCDARAQTTLSTTTAGVVLGNTTNYPNGNPFTVGSGTTIGNAGTAIYGDASKSWTLTNYGTITSSGSDGVYFKAGGSIANAGTSARISGQSAGVGIAGTLGTVTNLGTILGTSKRGVYLAAGGSVANTGSSALISGGTKGIYIKNGLGTVTNQGTIAGTGTSGWGVFINSGGYLANSATSATIAGGYGGVAILLTGTVINHGTITGSSSQVGRGVSLGAGYLGNAGNSALISGRTGVYVSYGAGTVTNAGTITGTTGGGVQLSGGTATNSQGGSIGGWGYGAKLNGTGVLSNAGTITGKNGGGAQLSGGTLTNSQSGLIGGWTYGAKLTGTGVLSNAGTITGTTGSGAELDSGSTLSNAADAFIHGGAFGIKLAAAGVVINAGTISDDGIAGASLGTGATLTNQSGAMVSGVAGILMTGNASVTNAGTIVGSGGTAVQFSSVGGTLTLQTGSMLTGTIDGGGGPGSVVLQGSGTAPNDFADFGTGSTLTMAGTAWTLGGTVALDQATVESGTLTVSGSLSGSTVQVQSGAALAGTGTIAANLTNAGTVMPGGAATIGTLEISGSFTQTATGVLEAAFDGAGHASLVQVSGPASLAGAVLLAPQGGGFLTGTRYTLVTATGGVGGSFAGASFATPLALLAPVLSYDADDAYVTLRQLAITMAGGTANERAAEAGLNAAVTAVPDPFQPSLIALDQLSAAGVQASLDRLSGEGYTGVETTALIAGEQFTKLIRQQADYARLGTGGNRVQLASLAGAGEDPVAAADKPWGVWLSGYGEAGKVSGDGNAHRLSQTIGGGAAGIDYKLSPALRVGAALGAGSTTFSLDNDNGRGQVDRVQFAVSAGWTAGPAYLQGLLGYGHGDGTVRRDVSLPGLPAQASGNVGDHQVMAGLEAGYGLALAGGSKLTPFAGFAFDTANESGLTETGAGALDLTVKSRTANSAKSLLGARFTTALPLGTTALHADLSAGWAHEWASTSRTATLAFAADPGASFTVAGARPARDGAVVGAGLATAVFGSASLYLRYDGELSQSSPSHALTAGFRVSW